MAHSLSSQNHKEEKGDEVEGMQVNINNIETPINIPECITIHELQHESDKNNHL